MVVWADVRRWHEHALLDACDDWRRAYGVLCDLADLARVVCVGMWSQGLSVEAMQSKALSFAGDVDALVADAGEMMMALADVADGVGRVRTKGWECEVFAQAHSYLRLGEDGCVSCELVEVRWDDPDMALPGERECVEYENRVRLEAKFELERMVQGVLRLAGEVDGDFVRRCGVVARGVGSLGGVCEWAGSFSQGLADLPDPSWSTGEVAAWWQALTVAERERLVREFPELVGNLDGVDAASRDAANRCRLPVLVQELEGEVERLTALHEEWQDRVGAEGLVDPGGVRHAVSPYLAALMMAQKRLRDAHAIEQLIQSDNDVSLLMLDDTGSARLRTAVAVGDVDEADHVATYVPGMGTAPGDNLDQYKDHAKLILETTGDANNGSVAVVAFLGYDAPAKLGDPGWSSVLGEQLAVEGGQRVKSWLEGIECSRVAAGDAVRQVVAAHSYGSLTASKALQNVMHGVVDDFVVFGSPGVGIEGFYEYNFDGGAYVSAVDSHDAVAGVGHWVHGPNPLDIDQFEHISGDAPGVSGLGKWVSPVARHSNYIMVDPVTGQPSGALRDIARIVAGVEP